MFKVLCYVHCWSLLGFKLVADLEFSCLKSKFGLFYWLTQESCGVTAIAEVLMSIRFSFIRTAIC